MAATTILVDVEMECSAEAVSGSSCYYSAVAETTDCWAATVAVTTAATMAAIITAANGSSGSC